MSPAWKSIWRGPIKQGPFVGTGEFYSEHLRKWVSVVTAAALVFGVAGGGEQMVTST
jgi:hypothetical protein